MATAAPELYPFSTQDGKAVPAEIIRPKKLIWWPLLTAVNKAIVIPDGMMTAYIFSTATCVLKVGGTAFASFLAGTEYTDAMLIPADTVVTVSLAPGDAFIWPLAAGTIYLSAIEQWAALSQQIQSRTQ